MKLLVDTCTFLWIVSESPRLSKTAAAAFLDRNNERYLSAASAWEIGIKYAIGRLPLPERPDILVPRVRDASGIASLDIDATGLHTDPFDRILVRKPSYTG